MFKYSIISYVNNRVSDEKISIGLIFINEDECKIRISDYKLDIVKILNVSNYSFLIKQLETWKNHKFSPDVVPY